MNELTPEGFAKLNRERGLLTDKAISGDITSDEAETLRMMHAVADAYIEKHAPRPTGVLEELEAMLPKWRDWPAGEGLYVKCHPGIRSPADLVRVTGHWESYLYYNRVKVPFDKWWGVARAGNQCRWYGPIPEDEK